jgi:hypothetical protein
MGITPVRPAIRVMFSDVWQDLSSGLIFALEGYTLNRAYENIHNAREYIILSGIGANIPRYFIFNKKHRGFGMAIAHHRHKSQRLWHFHILRVH